jgi:hypothetical protein
MYETGSSTEREEREREERERRERACSERVEHALREI